MSGTLNEVQYKAAEDIDAAIKGDKMDVAVQDQTTDVIDYYMCREIRALTLSSGVSVDDRVISVVSASGVLVGSYLCFQEGSRAFQARILSIATNDLTIDTPIDFDFTVSASVSERSPDMNVDGSVTPVSFTVTPVGTVEWDVVRIIGNMTHSSAGNDSLFGNLAALTNGIVLRKSNGIHHTIFNAKTNGALRERMYDVSYQAALGAAPDATGFRRTFGGQDKNGVVIRLSPSDGDSLELLVQDDLSGLTSFRVVAQGHVVED